MCLLPCIVTLHVQWFVLVVSAGDVPIKCVLGSRACHDETECVLYNHVCDGETDCRDGSDEDNCAVTCNADQFQCAHGKKCISKKELCDGQVHCQDRSDELNCRKTVENCAHQCDNKKACLPDSFFCDGERDCLDGTDEAHCDSDVVAEGSISPDLMSVPLKCPRGSRFCKDKTECVLFNHVCDGENDCRDGSDEEDCTLECESGQFQCAHGKKCILQKEVCDGEFQCQDRSDELDCSKDMEGCTHQCDATSRCFPQTFVCDGEQDCLDGSDEADCGEESCSAGEFRCDSGQCVSLSMRCDGHPDCRDHSDEERCSQPAECSTKKRCPKSHECLLEEWICDGDQDCKDGTDEKNCNIPQLKCGEFQWVCSSGVQCIPKAWKCDNTKDCDDGSDETDCGRILCHPHKFQCGSSECLDMAMVCNGRTNCADGADEGGDCQTKCSSSNPCSQNCYSTPKGPRCGCASGFTLDRDGVSCVDVNECVSGRPGLCSHLCNNTQGSYRCACSAGYVMEADGHRCKVTGEPFLLASVQSELFLLGLRSRSLDVLMSSTKKAILSVDYDWKEQKVFWVSLDSDTIRWSSLDQKNKGVIIKGVKSDCIAVDWIGRNLYWIDGVSSQIIAIKLGTENANALDYSVILDEDFEQPRSLALMPQKGTMFWTEIGNEPKIERAGMDGSERIVVVSHSLSWPGGIVVDALSDRIYWTDEGLQYIGSATLDGDDLKILQTKETSNPFSLVVFNDMLYWSDAKKRTVQVAHKITGKNRQVLLKRPQQPFSLKIIHPLLQFTSEKPCEKLRCSHLCVLAPGPKAVCKCPSGLLLAKDGLTCSNLVNSAFVLLLSASTVTQIYLQALQTGWGLKGWPEHLRLPLSNVYESVILDYSLNDHTLFLVDGGTSSLGLFKLKENNLVFQGHLLKLLEETICAMALDWISLNVYWSSSKQPRLHVTSTSGRHTAVLIHEDIGTLESIAVHPPSGSVCFTNVGENGKVRVEHAHMDGAKRSVIWKDATHPISLAYSNDGNEVYWADAGNGVISSVRVDGSGHKEFKTGDGLVAFTLIEETLLWVTIDDTTNVWYKDEQQNKRLWFEVNAALVSMKAYSKSSQTGFNRCSVDNGDCHHLCLATPGGRTCKCAYNHVFMNATHCTLDQNCPSGSRLCLDGFTCLPQEKFCDGHVDCPDHSDENCLHVKENSIAKTTHTTGSPTSAGALGLSSTVDPADLWRNLDSQQCSASRCSGNGVCVETDEETSCECSFGFSGDLCEAHFFKTMQSPLIYGSVGLFAGVVIITILILWVKKRKSANRSCRETSPLGKETKTDLEKLGETSIPLQPATYDTNVAEEAVSSVD